MILSREIDMALGVLERSGPWMVAVVVLLLAIFIGGKYLERRRLTSLYRARRIQPDEVATLDRKSTRLNSSHQIISYAVFCLKKKKKRQRIHTACSLHRALRLRHDSA